VELRVVENIECFQPELQRLRFSQPQVLLKRHVKVADSRSVEESSPGGADLAQCREGEERGVKCRPSVARVGVDRKIARGEVWRVHAVVVDAVGDAAQQGSVVVVEECDRETRAESRYSGNCPSLRQPLVILEQMAEG